MNLWRSRKLAWPALLLALVLVVAACGGDTDDPGAEATTTLATEPETSTTAGDTGTTAGTDTTAVAANEYCADAAEGRLIWAHEQEPPDLHLDDPANNLSTTAWARQGLLDGLYGITAATTFFPELLAEEAVMTDNGDGTFTGTFVLRDGLVWSDGDDLTGDDVKFTFDIIMATIPDASPDDDIDPADPDNPDRVDPDPEFDFPYLIGDRTGYDTITSFEVTSPTEFTITWSAFFGGWKALFAEVYPAHPFDADPAVAAAELNDAFREWTLASGDTIPTSGPMVFESWDRGVAMHYGRNDNYNGSQSPDVRNTGTACVSGIDITYVTDTDAQINSLRSNQAHVIMVQPQTQFSELATDANFTVNPQAGPVWEHWGFNLLNPHLAKSAVREALAHALDKQQVVETLYTPLFGDLLPTAGLGNTYWMSNQPTYEDHQSDAGYGTGDVEAARALLEGAGYVEGAGGIYEHPEDGPLSLRVGTTGGNQLRELQQQLIQAQMLLAGIEIVIENLPGGEYFSVPFGLPVNEETGETNWEITQFAWVGGPWPGSASFSYRTGSGNNPYQYANADFDAKSEECDQIVDEAAAAVCYNELDLFVTTLGPDGESGLIVLPLTQKPSFFAYSNTALSAGAISPDANSAGPIVNVVDYKLAG